MAPLCMVHTARHVRSLNAFEFYFVFSSPGNYLGLIKGPGKALKMTI